MVGVIMCAVFGDCRLRVGLCELGETGTILPYPIDLSLEVSPLYNTGHTTVWPTLTVWFQVHDIS